MKIKKEKLEMIESFKSMILNAQKFTDSLYLRAKVMLDTDDEDAYLHDYLYGNISSKERLNKIKKRK